VSDSKQRSKACICGSPVERRRRTARGSGESRLKLPPEANPKRRHGDVVSRPMQGPGAGGWRPGGSDWPDSSIRGSVHTQIRRPVAGMLRTRRGSYQSTGYREVESDGQGSEGFCPPPKLPPSLLPKKPRGNPDKADCSSSKCRYKNWYEGPGAGVEAAGGH